MKNLNVRTEIIKLFEENSSGKLLDISFGNGFLDVIAKTRATKAKMDKRTMSN